MLERLRQFRDAFNWGPFAYRLAVFLGLTGIAGSIGGTAWAMVIHVPTPIALMAGYCTLVGAVYLAMAPLAYRALAQSPANKPTKESKKLVPVYAAWRHLSSYELQDVANLWAEMDPIALGNNHSAAWYEAFKAAIVSGEVEIETNYPDSHTRQSEEIKNAGDRTKVKKESLRKFAKKHGYDPIFLRDS